jgi:hypothetical protein
MTERESGFVPPSEPRLEQERFQAYFPGHSIESAELASVPDQARQLMEEKRGALVSQENYTKGRLEGGHVITHPDGSRTYVATTKKIYSMLDEEESTYFVDMEGGSVLGYGELRKDLSKGGKYFTDKPFVGYTRTEAANVRQGLGLRRLEMMNAFSQMKYSLPLYSDTVMNTGATSRWEELVRAGKAEKFKEGREDRYVFKSK